MQPDIAVLHPLLSQTADITSCYDEFTVKVHDVKTTLIVDVSSLHKQTRTRKLKKLSQMPGFGLFFKTSQAIVAIHESHSFVFRLRLPAICSQSRG